MGLKKMMAEEEHHEDEIVNNPFLILGFGINAYFDMMLELCHMFLVISVFFIPVFMWYSGNKEGALRSKEMNPFKQLRAITMGNLGGATTMCTQKKYASGSLSFECPTGLDIDYDNIIYGSMSTELDVSYYCQEQAIFEAIKGGDSSERCTKYLEHQFVYNQVQECKKEFTKDPELNKACKISFIDKKTKNSAMFANDNGVFKANIPSTCTNI
jgi:hypothetical protein